MLYINVFVATTWDLYFLLKDSYYKSKSVADISLDIQSHLGFLFDQQGKNFPDLTDMIIELKQTRLLSEEAFFDSPQKVDFVRRYVEDYSRQ